MLNIEHKLKPIRNTFLLLFLLLGGAVAPPAIPAANNYLFATELNSYNVHVYEMDDEGRITPYRQLSAGWEAWNIAVSTEGRVIAFGSMYQPRLTIFFLQSDGSITTRKYYDIPDNLDYPEYIPIVFHPSAPLLFTGFYPFTSYSYSLESMELNGIGHIAGDRLISYRSIGYSRVADSLVYARWSTATTSATFVAETLKVLDDGSFGDTGTTCPLSPTHILDAEVAVNGRWFVVGTYRDSSLHLVRIDPDGSVANTHEVDIPRSETSDPWNMVGIPNSNYLLLLSSFGTHQLRSFEIDEQREILVQRSWIRGDAPGWLISSAIGLTVTPEGRYAAFRSFNPRNPGKTLIHLVRIHEDGNLAYLNGKEFYLDYPAFALRFAPIPEANATEWVVYE